MRHLAVSSVLCVGLMVSSLAVAAPPGERVADRKEIRKDRRQIGDDVRDAARLGAILRDLRAARREGRPLDGIWARLRKVVEQELREGRREVRQQRREVQRSRKELARDRRAVKRARAHGRPGFGPARAAKDDRRDLADDRRDLARERHEQARRKAIAKELRALVGKRDPKSLDKAEALIQDLIHLNEAEVGAGRKELREDRRELREDRRTR